jgi:hypothetical protein
MFARLAERAPKRKEQRMPHYVSVHYEPLASRAVIESKWKLLAQERRAIWLKTWYNFDIGKRFCWWDSPDKDQLEKIFQDHGVTWEEIIQVELTTPSDWRWRED